MSLAPGRLRLVVAAGLAGIALTVALVLGNRAASRPTRRAARSSPP